MNGLSGLPQRDRAALWGPARTTGAPVTRELLLGIARGFYPEWDVWTLGGRYVAAPKGTDPLSGVAVINAATMSELIQKISGAPARAER